jgi:hypothetical protein
MSKNKTLFAHSIFIDCELNQKKVSIKNLIIDNSNSFDIEIIFNSPIQFFRNHDYTWVDVLQNRIANSFSPKIVKLENGTLIQANCNHGIWVINSKKTNVLLWRFNPDFATPITQYCNEINTKKIISAHSNFDFIDDLALLITNQNAIELSRSEIPFSAVACFTDHCDYDTAENLVIQREFFKKLKIKTTKGFFLNHFSKRDDNASYENDKLELQKWENDGHEMCYHSLTQSIRTNKEAFEEFENFIPPFQNTAVWIDHGFQPYNFTMFEKNKIPNAKYESTLIDKKIEVLWNYIDAGNATTGIINQLNTSQFNLEKYSQSIQNKSFLKRMVLIIKNIIFHYDNDEFRVRNYIDAIANVKAITKKKRFIEIFELIKNVIPLKIMLLKVLFTWNKAKKTTYKVAKYSPLFFKHIIDKKEFYIFQTIEMVDFKTALCKSNIDSLINESGIFIAHTYFSVNMKHYEGKLINSDGTLNQKVVDNFSYLSNKIQNNKIWNPTLSALLDFYKKFQNTSFDIDEKGTIFIKNNLNIPSRTIQ